MGNEIEIVQVCAEEIHECPVRRGERLAMDDLGKTEEG